MRKTVTGATRIIQNSEPTCVVIALNFWTLAFKSTEIVLARWVCWNSIIREVFWDRIRLRPHDWSKIWEANFAEFEPFVLVPVFLL